MRSCLLKSMDIHMTISDCRYIDDIFMTSNETINDIREELERVKTKDVNIKIEYDIGTSVNFLDVTIMNENGQLRTSIYHKSAAEPYILPFTSDHPRHIHRNIPYAALMRAARLCSHVEDFDGERVRSDVSLLLNDYPQEFITQQSDRFFRVNYSMVVLDRLDKNAYSILHRKLLHTPTRREKQLILMTQDPVRNPSVLHEKPWNATIMCPRYTFDSANILTFPSRFHKWWSTFYGYPESPARRVEVRLVANINHTLEKYFIHKKPSKDILCDMKRCDGH